MPIPLNKNSYWLKANDKIIRVDRKRYHIKVEVAEVLAPYQHMELNVMAEPLDKDDIEYQRIKHILGEDFPIDVLESGDAFYMAVFAQCFPEGVDK